MRSSAAPHLPNFRARRRLDARSYGTMGVGLGITIAACAA